MMCWKLSEFQAIRYGTGSELSMFYFKKHVVRQLLISCLYHIKDDHNTKSHDIMMRTMCDDIMVHEAVACRTCNEL